MRGRAAAAASLQGSTRGGAGTAACRGVAPSPLTAPAAAPSLTRVPQLELQQPNLRNHAHVLKLGQRLRQGGTQEGRCGG